MMGTRCSWQIRAITDTCSVVLGYATATGKVSGLTVDHSEYPWACKSSGSVEMSPSTPISSSIRRIAYSRRQSVAAIIL
jgi:hypothetical protein